MRKALPARRLRWAAWAGIAATWAAAARAEGPYRTPLAGQELQTEVFGEPVTVPARDRNRVTAIDLGLQWVAEGPEGYGLLPFGAVFLWRSWDQGRERLRLVVNGFYNEGRYHIGIPSISGAEAVLTFETMVVPLPRAEFVEGVTLTGEDLIWGTARGGVGFGARQPVAPGHEDNAVEAAFTYEPGALVFFRADTTASGYVLPRDAYEGRFHLRLRWDGLERNLLELPHRGAALGADAVFGHRPPWKDWGGGALGSSQGFQERGFAWVSVYGVLAGGLPFVDSERHRLVLCVHAGAGTRLDRFSGFRLGGGPIGWEWEALSRPVLPGAAFEEFFVRHYAIVDLEYRLEVIFFFFPYLRATWAAIDRPRTGADGAIIHRTDSLPALAAGLVSGAPWESQIELSYSYAFGMFRFADGRSEPGGHALVFHWAKEF